MKSYWRRAFDHLVVGTFGAWLVATVLSQHPDSALDRVRRWDDGVGNTVIPNWRFFAPNPAVEDVRIMYRFANKERTEHSAWKELQTISPRSIAQVLWFPGRREEKAVFDAHQTIMVGMGTLASGKDVGGRLEKAVNDSITLLNEFVLRKAEVPTTADCLQVMLVRFAGNDPEARPICDAVLDYFEIEDEAEYILKVKA
ncbi:hypothetical protein QP119_05060 [Corynebacterium frankenforstense]|uniref:hypothetical protein n=1 Tax=Corynebacterium TaxID=1716 RepID=UPI002549C315|nr:MULTISPECIES: hypothetical protein [Corynebacterium]MDK6259793.1 hypothetical protein [Corynebacterium frankenforstense]MDK8894263.1 hypothetical protein [Corynebacterium sp. MSK006]